MAQPLLDNQLKGQSSRKSQNTPYIVVVGAVKEEQ
jgi:hypothetical protein